MIEGERSKGQDAAEFHALYWHFGPYGRQDVHLHPRIDRDSETDVLVGYGHSCDPRQRHVRKRLTVNARWRDRDCEGLAL